MYVNKPFFFFYLSNIIVTTNFTISKFNEIWFWFLIVLGTFSSEDRNSVKNRILFTH